MNENLVFDDQSNPPQPGSTPGSLKFTFAPPGTATPAEPTPTTPAGKSGTSAATVEAIVPGKRSQNPLANFSSYTYQISWYMITPDAYESFILSGRKSITNVAEITPAEAQNARDSVTSNNAPTRTGGQANGDTGGSGSPPPPSSASSSTKRGGTYLIAQSGGINNSTTTRAPGFDLDFYIDDLKIKQIIGSKDVGAPTNYTDVTFNITEPYGFSLLTKLREAQKALSAVTGTPNFNSVSDPLRQLYIVGIKFLGYDKNGELIDPSSLTSADGSPIGNSSGIYERFFDIIVKDLKFKITGKAVTYSVVGQNAAASVAMGTKFGRVTSDVNVTADTVYNALLGGSGAEAGGGRGGNMVGLLSKLNYDQELLVGKGVNIPRKYDVTFVGPTSDFIKNALLVSNNDLDKRKVPTTSATNSSQSNEKASQNNPIQSNKRTIKIVTGTTIIQAVNDIVKQSQYMEQALSAIGQAAVLTPDPDKKEIQDGGNDGGTGDTSSEASKKPSPINWFNINAEVINLGWDTNQSDYIYKINYIIQTYETPVVVAASAKVIPYYYGPQKRYEYWYTGKNSEIIGYEQQMDYAYHNVTLQGYGVDSAIPSAAQGGSTDVPVTVGLPQDQPRQGRINGSMESQNAYMTSLFSPADFAKAKIKILGDPDFLMQSSPSSINSLYNQFYGTDGFTINPNGGQVFIEINFKEPQDYHNDTGTMSISNSIYFWKFPADVQKAIDKRGGGISYMVRIVTSTFNKGKFEQELECSLNTFGSTSPAAGSAADQGRPSTNQTDAETARLNRSGIGAATTPSGTSTTNSTGFVPSKAAILGSASALSAPNATTTVSTRGGPMLKQNTTVTNNKGVQEDDAGYDSTAGIY